MPELRIRFEKRGRAAYLSHLDVMRTFQRAFIRAGVRLKHSEGFNPHPKMSIAMPLQLGCESVSEILDAVILEAPEDLVGAMNRALPEGIRVLSVGTAVQPVRNIAWSRWELRFDSEADASDAETVLRRESLPVEKKTKRGLGILDIAPHMELLEREGSVLRLHLRAAEPVVNAGDVQKAVRNGLGREVPVRALRTALLNGEKELFA